MMDFIGLTKDKLPASVLMCHGADAEAVKHDVTCRSDVFQL